MKNLVLYLFLLACSVASSSVLATPNLDIIVPCNGCSDWQMQKTAEAYAVQKGQKIYVSDNVNGQFYIKEYVVNYVNPGSLDFGIDASNDVSLLKNHTPQSSALSQNLARTDSVIKGTVSNIDNSVLPIPNDTFKSAFKAVTDGDFLDWLTEEHIDNKLNGFDILDAEFAKLRADVKASIQLGIFNISTVTKVATIRFKFADDTTVSVGFFMRDIIGGKIKLEFNDAKFFDKRGKFIPKSSKHLLKIYIKNISSFEEVGDRGAVKEHFEYVFEAPVYYNGGGSTGGGPSGDVGICDITQERGVYYVSCT
ncbi:hypothetical protein [Pseudoalteromonas sp. S16_S37]|uniref:hypothetical protein n=1 Tax=Pseudoalteromonas sp. S16_S37 TaxID=2720228 RepID=UPI001681182F|nr:hypothetical protein [Pseudoalteromonas sp. S16_S37]MBD1582874.1 hypothetical protein [Pseudoalteromonas sp. S16_S37]